MTKWKGRYPHNNHNDSNKDKTQLKQYIYESEYSRKTIQMRNI